VRHSNHIGLIYPFVIVAVLIQLWIASIAFGGIDIDRYYFYSFGVDYNLPRYFKEPISWELVRFLSAFAERGEFLLGVAILVLAMSVLFLGWRRGLILYATFLSPFGIMLEFNVLRQCFGTLLMSVAAYHLAGDRQKLAMFFSVAAILCHTSSIFTISVLFSVYYVCRMTAAWRVATILSTACVLAGLQAFGVLAVLADLSTSTAADFVAIDEDGPENMLYAVASLLICMALYFLGKARNLRVVATGLAASTLLAVAICLLLSMGSWVYGRIAVGNMIIGSFLLLQHLILRRQAGLADAALAFGLLTFNGLLIFAHPGTMYMVTGLR